MRFSPAALILFSSGVYGFSPAPNRASFVSSRVSNGASPKVVAVAGHPAGCSCGACARYATALFSEAPAAEPEAATSDDVPAEVEALDGIASDEEAHNADRPARKSLKKKGPKGKPLSEFSVGDTVPAKVKTIASYGAFMDFGAQTDGLVHISQLSVDFVSDVNEFLKVGEEVNVRIVGIDEKKGQVALTLLSEEQEEEAKERISQPRQRERQQSNRRNDSAVQAALTEKGWDASQFVEGTVVSIVDFGAFVKINASLLNSEVEGEIDGLVHISALANKRVDRVGDVVSIDDKVQVRVKDIANNKVSLSMVSVEDEAAKAEKSANGPAPVGNKNWAADLRKLQEDMPEFQNRPLVVDMRK